MLRVTNIVYVIESAVYGVIFTSCLCENTNERGPRVVSVKTRTSEVRASEGFSHKQRVNIAPYKAISMT